MNQLSFKFDLVIPLALKDVFILKKNIHFIRLNINPSRIYILTNRKWFSFFSKDYRQKNGIILMDENNLLDGLTFNRLKSIMISHFGNANRLYGWYFQQILKMAFAKVHHEIHYYLIWDADTIPTKNLTFFSPMEKIFFNSRIDHNKPYFDTINRLLNIDVIADYSFITEHMMINSEIMSNLINEISSNIIIEGETWYEKIINAVDINVLHGFSEFETYGTYVLNHYADKYELRELNTFRDAGRLYGRYITQRKIEKEFCNKYDTISLEQWQTPRFPYNIFDYIMKMSFKVITKIYK